MAGHHVNPIRKKLLIAGAVLAVAVTYLAYRGVAAGQSYYMSVDKFLTDDTYRSSRVRLSGVVAREGLTVDSDKTTVDFVLRGETRTIRVHYQGLPPSTFQADRPVVVAGHLGSGEVFEAEQLLTKCASKYSSKPGMPEVSQ